MQTRSLDSNSIFNLDKKHESHSDCIRQHECKCISNWSEVQMSCRGWKGERLGNTVSNKGQTQHTEQEETANLDEASPPTRGLEKEQEAKSMGSLGKKWLKVSRIYIK